MTEIEKIRQQLASKTLGWAEEKRLRKQLAELEKQEKAKDNPITEQQTLF